jgi:hypothetical protein
MKELRERVALPTDVDLSERAPADLVRRVASRLAPGLERSVGPVHWTAGETTGIDWTAEGFVEGVLVVVCLRPTSREVSLLVDPRIAPPAEGGSRSTSLLMLGALGASAAAGFIRRSLWWAVFLFIGTMAAWISADIVRHELRKKRAIAAFDEVVWRRRFRDAMAVLSTFR